jgi:hypothetical protein
LSQAYSLPPWVGLTLLVLVCGSAFWKGGREEQVAAGAVLLSVVATVVLRDPRWIGLQWGAFGADVLLLLALGAVALRTRRYWPLFAAAFQLLCVLIHVARLIDPGVRGWAYATGQVIFTQWVLITIGVGVWNTWRGRAQAETIEAPIVAPGATRR